MSNNKNNQEIIKAREERNARRRRQRLDKYAGLDWIDPEPGSVRVWGERALWRAVITQMLEDAANKSTKPNDLYNKHVARHWLTSGSDDFYMVCDLAGLDVAYLRRNIKRALLNNCKWRKEPKRKAQKQNVKRRRRKVQKKVPEITPPHDFHTKSLVSGDCYAL